MGFVTTTTKVIRTEKSIATQNMDSLFRRFEVLQDEALRSPAKLPASFSGKSVSSSHRVSVRIYYMPSERDQPTL